MLEDHNLQTVMRCLIQGGIIAYPTEAVFGLGCDPFNEQTVLNLLMLKKRELSKGLILITSSWQQIAPLILPITDNQLSEITTWQEPITWLLPASAKAPSWITGEHASIAVRLTKHPIAHQLCEAFGKPIVSTSANYAGYPPARSASQVTAYFPHRIDCIIEGDVGNLGKPTPIRCIMTGHLIRD